MKNKRKIICSLLFLMVIGTFFVGHYILNPKAKDFISSKITSLYLILGSEITSLDIPQGLEWKDGSTATAKWDAVANANYYTVNVYVYNNGTLIGSTETGTSINEIDLQHEINSIVGVLDVSSVQVKFDVKAILLYDDGTSIIGEKSDNSTSLEYITNMTVPLSTPVNLNLDLNTYTASWDQVENADCYKIIIKYDANGTTKTYTTLYESGTKKDGKVYLDLESDILYGYNYNKLYGTEVTVSFKVFATVYSTGTKNFSDSDYSEWSNGVLYLSEEPSKLLSPLNLNIDSNTYTASWDQVENADCYKIIIKYDANGITKTYTTLYKSGTKKDGKVYLDLESDILYGYNYNKLYGTEVTVSFKVFAAVYSTGTKNFSDSDYSEWSNGVLYLSEEPSKLLSPVNLNVDPNTYTASWDQVENADCYKIIIKYDANGITKTYTTLYKSGTKKDGKVYLDLESDILHGYNYNNLEPAPVTVSFKAFAAVYSTGTKNFSNSDYSNYSEEVLYNPNELSIVEKITLSPNQPVVALGKSIYIGKTITPIDGYYSTIRWFSSNLDIVSINSSGQITGKKVGTTYITAKILNVEQTALVSVYEINSNIANSTQSKEVIDEAVNIIDSIVTNKDTSNTDITDVDTVVGEIESGAQNGNQFKVDINYDEKTETDYLSIKDAIEEKYSGMNIGGGYDIAVELYHLDDEETKHHIANITELETDIDFNLNMVNGLPELASTKQREYQLVRYHNGQLDSIEATFNNDGTVTSSSNKFSDFIFLYSDSDIRATDLTIDKTSITLNKGEESTIAVSIVPENAANKNYTSVSNDINVATVDGNKINAVGVGTTTVTFTSEDGEFTKTVSVTVHSPLIGISLNKESGSLNVGEEENLTVMYNPTDTTDDKTVTWTTSNNKIATVENGTVTAIAPGTAIITATVGSKTATYSVTVYSPLVSISLNKTSGILELNETETLMVTYNPTDTTDDKTVSWESSDSTVATVENGTVTAISEGTATITATVGSKTAEYEVEVKEYHLEEITLNESNLEIDLEEEENLTVIYNPTNTTDHKTVTWTTSNDKVVEVENGIITGTGYGTATVTATVGSKIATCIVKVKDYPLESIRLNKSSGTITIGNSETLIVIYNPTNTTDDKIVIWTTDNSEIATVENGKVTAIAVGETNITATVGSKTATYAVTVKEATNLYKIVTEKGFGAENGLFHGLKLGDTIANLKEKLGSDVTINTSNSIIGTGVQISYNGETYTAVVYGDITGDGSINSADLLKMRQYLLGTSNLTGAYKQAASIANGSTINSADLLRLRQHLLGTNKINQ